METIFLSSICLMRTIRGLLGERKIGYPTNCLLILKPKYIGKTTTTTIAKFYAQTSWDRPYG